MQSMPLDPVFAAEVPKQLWAALMMLAFVAISALTMLLARVPTRQKPPPIAGDAPDEESAPER
jgi:hypothetical protein